jgi:hypothetical protein
MDSDDKFIAEISKKDINVEKYAQIILNDTILMNLVIKNLISNLDIMVYYHCYLIIAFISKEKPKTIYKYWDILLPLFRSNNSYHRNYGLEIFANLTTADKENKFDLLFKEYFSHLNHQKFLTIRYCIMNSIKIINNKKHLILDIIDLLLKALDKKELKMKQRNLLKSDILEILDKIMEELKEDKHVNKFLKTDSPSDSPKIKKMLKDIIKKYNL